MEHRQRARWPTQMPAVLVRAQGAIPCVVLNADPQGVYVRCSKPLRVGECPALALVNRAEDGTRLLRVPAMVVRTEGECAGLLVEQGAIPLRDMLPPPAPPQFSPPAPHLPPIQRRRVSRAAH